MRKSIKQNAQLIVTVTSDKKTGRLETESIFDKRTNKYWSKEHIEERGVARFSDLADLKETLNWNIDCDDSEYDFEWGQSGKDKSTGYAYLRKPTESRCA